MELFYPFNNEHRTCDKCGQVADKKEVKETTDKNIIMPPLSEVSIYGNPKTKPMELPPKHTPPKCDSCTKTIDSTDYPKYGVSAKAISCCLDKLTYIWQNDKKEYWCYIFYIDHVCFVGWRWEKHINDWVYFGIDISKVEAFSCKRE